MLELIVWLVTLLLGVVITIIANEPIQYLLARAFGRWIPLQPRGVKGIWEAVYTWRGAGEEIKTEHQLVELGQFGKYVVGQVLRGQVHSHTFQGKVQLETYFTGIWESNVVDEIYSGALQVVIDVRGKRMKGAWIGFDSQNDVQCGPYEWQLQSRDNSSAIRTGLIAEFDRKYRTSL